MPNILNKTPMALIPTKGTEAQILDPIVNWYQRPGMLFYATDTEKLFVSNGTEAKPVNGVTSKTFRYDSDTSYAYCGIADSGSPTSAEVWTITRLAKIDLSETTATGVAWDDRETVEYGELEVSGLTVNVFKYDSADDYVYCGVATSGSATSAEVWTITRITKADLTSVVATLVSWDDRETIVYT